VPLFLLVVVLTWVVGSALVVALCRAAAAGDAADALAVGRARHSPSGRFAD
jgi:hypothetical protein